MLVVSCEYKLYLFICTKVNRVFANILLRTMNVYQIEFRLFVGLRSWLAKFIFSTVADVLVYLDLYGYFEVELETNWWYVNIVCLNLDRDHMD